MNNTLCLVNTFLALKANLERIPNMAYGIGKPQIIHHKIATSKNVGSKNVTENCLYLKKGLNIEFSSYCFLNSGNTTEDKAKRWYFYEKN